MTENEIESIADRLAQTCLEKRASPMQHALYAALAGAAGGAGLTAVDKKQRRHVKSYLRNALLGAMAGGGLGYAGSTLYDTLSGAAPGGRSLTDTRVAGGGGSENKIVLGQPTESDIRRTLSGGAIGGTVGLTAPITALRNWIRAPQMPASLKVPHTVWQAIFKADPAARVQLDNYISTSRASVPTRSSHVPDGFSPTATATRQQTGAKVRSATELKRDFLKSYIQDRAPAMEQAHKRLIERANIPVFGLPTRIKMRLFPSMAAKRLRKNYAKVMGETVTPSRQLLEGLTRQIQQNRTLPDKVKPSMKSRLAQGSGLATLGALLGAWMSPSQDGMALTPTTAAEAAAANRAAGTFE